MIAGMSDTADGIDDTTAGDERPGSTADGTHLPTPRERRLAAWREAPRVLARLGFLAPLSQRLALLEAAGEVYDLDEDSDLYGNGVVAALEQRVAGLLGTQDAAFFPTGTMAQQVALRCWAGRTGDPTVALHPLSHPEVHERGAFSQVSGLRPVRVTSEPRLPTAEEVRDFEEPFGALMLELPLRDAGFVLPTWEELTEVVDAAREREAVVHFDGARLWECAAGYGRSYAEICAGFDSCYVSFYKGIGALSGAMLLGQRDFIDEAIVWQRRSGGNLYTLAPSIASAAMLLDRRLARMKAYYQRARRIAEILGAIGGVSILPAPPQVNMMHVFLALDPEAAMEARDRVAEESGIWLFGAARPAAVPGHSRFELYVGEAAMALDDAEIEAALRSLMGHS